MFRVFEGRPHTKADQAQRARCERAADWLCVDSDGCLAAIREDESLTRIPAIAERAAILADFQSLGAHPSGDRLY